MLTRIAEGLHVVTAPQRLLFIELGTRMTVIELEGGGLALHSPVPYSLQLADEVARLGEVRAVVAPNLYHHMHVAPWLSAFPNASLVAPAALAKKRRDLRIDHALSAEDEDLPAVLRGTLEGLAIRGCALGETVFLHPRSRTLVSSDLTENFQSSTHLPTKLYLKAAGLEHRVGWSRFLRVLYRDHTAAQESVSRLLDWDFDRLILAHGDLIDAGAKDAIRQTFHFLRPRSGDDGRGGPRG
jgi:hypothetical protein